MEEQAKEIAAVRRLFFFYNQNITVGFVQSLSSLQKEDVLVIPSIGIKPIYKNTTEPYQNADAHVSFLFDVVLPTLPCRKIILGKTCSYLDKNFLLGEAKKAEIEGLKVSPDDIMFGTSTKPIYSWMVNDTLCINDISYKEINQLGSFYREKTGNTVGNIFLNQKIKDFLCSNSN